MFPSLNLRFDLAKLSETELVQRVDEAWRSYHAAEAEKQPWIELRNSWNGPIRHPVAYRFLSFFERRYSGGWSLTTPGFQWGPTVDMHLALCEIRDLMDELERRVARRKARHA
jgi:allophanate hydrolase subunit 1